MNTGIALLEDQAAWDQLNRLKTLTKRKAFGLRKAQEYPQVWSDPGG
jgi:hypothetical protein